jgi:hypothetical protein
VLNIKTQTMKNTTKDNFTPVIDQMYAIYKEFGGVASREEFDMAMNDTPIGQLRNMSPDVISVTVSNYFGDLFVNHCPEFLDWYDRLPESVQFNVYGQIIGMNPATILACIQDEEAYKIIWDGLKRSVPQDCTDETTIWQAIEQDNFVSYDALVNLVKDAYAPYDNEKAKVVEDRFNALFAVLMKDMDKQEF